MDKSIDHTIENKKKSITNGIWKLLNEDDNTEFWKVETFDVLGNRHTGFYVKSKL